MGNLLQLIDWKEKNNREMDKLLSGKETLSVQSMNSGYEAEVVKIIHQGDQFVLKIWNRDSNPNIQFQYHLLHVLTQREVPVSMPLAWGVDNEGNKVLLTTYDGLSFQTFSSKNLTETARILSKIHGISPYQIKNVNLPKYHFIDYFFSGIEEHLDLSQLLIQLIKKAQITQSDFIHGDYHFENIVEETERFTVIDWTNAQLGDKRYDFAWSVILLKIYGISEKHASLFRLAYISENSISQDEEELFEAIACIRWLLLYRKNRIPIRNNTLDKVQKIIKYNPYLNKTFFYTYIERNEG
ncbi:aminoglycoside phosphotransferase family protein [Heyndrickxia oleronia]|uniref:Aminoglycoside phosphotransferase family protein n=1 Tax=Heyndrickxia oleronia TaxID=38875 RepID=A0AAW6SQ70_9BACI|nr:aminoglycoside phosphotransferase family protein [Heyndrickxia oleronia]MDH5160914.1 aminoglycoside phosphotransferase family protein [Heyndrickxia oleronia]